MFVLVFMSLRVSSCIRVFVYLRTNESAMMTKSSAYMRNTSYSKFFEVLTQKTRMFSSDEFQVILNWFFFHFFLSRVCDKITVIQ